MSLAISTDAALTNSPVSLEESALLAAWESAAEAAASFAALARAPATTRAYDADFACFETWCRGLGLSPLPASPRVVAAYLAAKGRTDQGKPLAIATLQRRLSSIAIRHRREGYSLDTRHPELVDAWAGIRRARGTARRRVAAATTSVVKAMLDAMPAEGMQALRDRAMLLIGFGGALRRSELVALDVGHLTFSPEGVTLRIARSKTDQEGQGTDVAIERWPGSDYCPVAALQAWLAAAGITDGAVFRSLSRTGTVLRRLSAHAVAVRVKDAAEAAGLDPRQFSGHSLRAGLATAAAAAGQEERHIAAQTRHKSVAVLRTYIRAGSLWQNNVSGAVAIR